MFLHKCQSYLFFDVVVHQIKEHLIYGWWKCCNSQPVCFAAQHWFYLLNTSGWHGMMYRQRDGSTGALCMSGLFQSEYVLSLTCLSLLLLLEFSTKPLCVSEQFNPKVYPKAQTSTHLRLSWTAIVFVYFYSYSTFLMYVSHAHCIVLI